MGQKTTFFLKTGIIFAWLTLIFGTLWFSSLRYFPDEESQTIQAFIWPGIFHPDLVPEFEKETGIKVKLHYYTSNEELFVKLKALGGKGYDLIVPSDYAVEILKEDNLLKKIDKTKLNFLPSINPILMNHYFDPENIFSIPYQWEVYGLGINVDLAKDVERNPSWDFIFNEKSIHGKIAMLSDPVEAVTFAAFYLFGPKQHLSEEQSYRVRRLLKRQKKWVESYAGPRADYLLTTKNCDIALSQSSSIFRTAKQNSNIKFILPKEWGIISIENVCIPSESSKEELVYQFLNFLYRPENLKKNTDMFFSFPARNDMASYIDISEEFTTIYNHPESDKGKFHFFRHLIPEKEIRDIWIDVKS